MDNIIEALKPLAIDIKSVHQDPRNARKHNERNLEAIKTSLQAYGQRKPIVVNSDGTIEAGNALWLAAKELGWDKIAVTRVDDSKEMAAAYGVMDNQSALLSEWDLPNLKDILQDLDTGAFNMEWTGFGDKEIEDLMTQFYQPKEGLTGDDEIPEKVETICKSGDLWQLGNHRLLCGDATKKEDMERLMGGEKADIVLTDPPYGINLDTDWSKIDGAKKSWMKGKRGGDYPAIIGDNEPFNPTSIFQFWGYVKEMFLFGADYYSDYIPDRLKGSWLVWDKRKESQADGIGSEFELIWSKQKHKRRVLRHEWFGLLHEGESGKRLHPTQKPIVLLVDILIQWGKGNLIIDPFGGSGSTLIACEKLGRRCFMMEIDEHYCDVIVTRWQNFTGKQAVKL